MVEAWSVSDQEFASASHWAAKSDDTQLTMQLTVLFNLHSLLKSVAAVEQIMRKAQATGDPSSLYIAKKIDTEKVSLVGKLRLATGTTFPHSEAL